MLQVIEFSQILAASTFWGDLTPLAWFGWKFAQVLLFVLTLALLVAALVLADRKIWAAVQMRRGPNVVGAFGLLQTIADALKFFFKEIVVPAGSDRFLFILAPVLTLVMAFLAWAVIPVAPGWVISDINIGVLYVLAISSMGVYGIIIGGWASNSKYPFMGALRSAAQMVSYEVSIGFIILTVYSQSCSTWASCFLSRLWLKPIDRPLTYPKLNQSLLRVIRLSIHQHRF